MGRISRNVSSSAQRVSDRREKLKRAGYSVGKISKRHAYGDSIKKASKSSSSKSNKQLAKDTAPTHALDSGGKPTQLSSQEREQYAQQRLSVKQQVNPQQRLSPQSSQAQVSSQQIKPTLNWKEKVKASYLATPFGYKSAAIPDEYQGFGPKKRSILGTLNYGYAKEALIAQKVKEQKAEQEVKSIDLFNKRVEAAPKEKKFMVYTEGLNELSMKGIRYNQEGDNIVFRSPNLSPSKTPYQYEWSKTDKTGKVLLSGQDISARATEVYLGGKAIGAGLKGVASVGNTLGLSKAATMVNPTTQAFSAVKGTTIASSSLKAAATYTAVGGVIGYSKVQEYKATPKEYKAGFWTGTTGQAIGLGALGYEGYKSNKVVKQTNIKKQAEFVKKDLRYKQLKNIKQTGKHTDYAKYGYKQKGVGAKFQKQIYKTGEDSSFFKEASGYKKVMKVKSPTGLKDYTTSKYGYSRSLKVDGKTVETAYEFKLYKGKPTSIVKLETIGKGQYALTKQYHITRSGNLKLDKTFVTSSVTGKPTEVRLTTKNTFTSPKTAWENTAPTMKTAEWNTITQKAVGGKGYLWKEIGQGKPFLATKGANKPMVLSKTKPTITSTKNPYAPVTKPSIKTYSSSSSTKLVKLRSTPQTKTIPVTTTATKIPTLSIGKLRPPTLSLATSTSQLSMLGGLTTTAMTSRHASTPKLSPSMRSISNVRATTTPVSITSPITSTPTINIGGGSTRIIIPRSPRIPTTPSTPIIPILIPPTTLGMVGGVVKKSKVGSKQRYAYTPSYTALVKGIKGKKPKKKKYTGLELRPITKGWLKNIYRKIR